MNVLAMKTNLAKIILRVIINDLTDDGLVKKARYLRHALYCGMPVIFSHLGLVENAVA